MSADDEFDGWGGVAAGLVLAGAIGALAVVAVLVILAGLL